MYVGTAMSCVDGWIEWDGMESALGGRGTC